MFSNLFRRQQHSTHQGPRELLASLLVMAWFVEARDPYTGGHLWRVSQYANRLAQAGGLPTAEVARVSLGGFLHDLGKIGTADNILNKPGTLSAEEYQQIQLHPGTGHRLLAGHPLVNLVRDAVELHHERPDGQGYPYGLQAQKIPVAARIVGLCDAFDAMTSLRPYRQPMSVEQARDIIQQNLGTQFDPEWGQHFLRLIDTGQVADILGHTDQGIPLHECLTCGPTITRKREQQAGERLYCRLCSAEVELTQVDNQPHNLQVKPTGRTGSLQDLQEEADHGLIRRLIEQTVSALPAGLEHHSQQSAYSYHAESR